MARFSQQMLAGLLNPSYQKELTQVGRAVGGTPGMLAARREKEERAKVLQSMGPVDLARMAEQEALKTGDPSAILKSQQATRGVVQRRTEDSLAKLDLERQKALNEGNTTKAEQIESTMERIATSAGLDASKITGRTSRESALLRTQREQNIEQAYYKLDPENRQKFVDAMTDAGFGKLITQLETERLKLEDAEKQRDKEKPLKDYSLTKAEENVYADLFEKNKEEFEALIPELEEKPLFTVPFFDIPVGGGKERVADLDEQTKILFDTAERIRTNNPDLTKKQALKQAIQEFSDEKVYEKLSEEHQATVDKLRASGVSEERIREAMITTLSQ